jgi:hypothetical protein
MTGAGDIRLDALVAAALPIGLERARADLGNRAGGIELLLARRRQPMAELVIEPFRAEVAFLVGNPFLQPPVRLDDEPGHDVSPMRLASKR